MLDRLLHHSVIFNIKGDSYRVKRRKKSMGKNNDHQPDPVPEG